MLKLLVERWQRSDRQGRQEIGGFLVLEAAAWTSWS